MSALRLPGPSYDERVLLVAPTRRDAQVTCQALAPAGVNCTACPDLPHLAREMTAGVGAVMLTDHVFAAPDFGLLLQALDAQPGWSSVPIVLLCRDREQSPAAERGIERLRNVTLLDRPASMRTMISTVQALLRGRRWQYQLRDQLVLQHQAEDALRQADRRKDEFLATLAHELRNPLAPIKTGLQLLRRVPPDEARAAPVLGMMDRQLGQLVRLIDELLDVSRIATGKVVLQCEPIDMRDVVRHALEASQPVFDAAGHNVQVALPPRAVRVLGDASRLSQALGNILNNAAKYTPPGGRIGVALATEGAEVLLSVSDNGAGIPAVMIENVFDLFAQVDRTLDRAQGGLGIGLSLVRSLVGLHGGKVQARSDGIDRGSVFEIRLPLLQEAAGAAPAAVPVGEGPSQPRAAAPLRVLVVDDNTDAADTLGLLLSLLGHTVRVEYAAPAAMRAIEAFGPDAVFCDLGMPGMSGHEFATRVREDGRYAATKLIAVTGWGGEEDQRRSRAAGFDHHLTKPASVESIEAVLARA